MPPGPSWKSLLSTRARWSSKNPSPTHLQHSLLPKLFLTGHRSRMLGVLMWLYSVHFIPSFLHHLFDRLFYSHRLTLPTAYNPVWRGKYHIQLRDSVSPQELSYQCNGGGGGVKLFLHISPRIFEVKEQWRLRIFDLSVPRMLMAILLIFAAQRRGQEGKHIGDHYASNSVSRRLCKLRGW